MIRNNQYLSNYAFSLIEIISVVILIGVIASIAFSNFSLLVERTKAKKLEHNLYIQLAKVKRYYIEENRFPSSSDYFDNKKDAFQGDTGYDSSMISSGNVFLYIFRLPQGTPFQTGNLCATSSWGTGLCGSGQVYALSLEHNLISGSITFKCSSVHSHLCTRLGF